jgi:hypothetical protein
VGLSGTLRVGLSVTLGGFQTFVYFGVDDSSFLACAGGLDGAEYAHLSIQKIPSLGMPGLRFAAERHRLIQGGSSRQSEPLPGYDPAVDPVGVRRASSSI